MLEEGKPDLVVAFPTGGPGTKHMVSIAQEAGVRIRVHRISGPLVAQPKIVLTGPSKREQNCPMSTQLQLPDVTLVLIDTIVEELSSEALNDTLELIEPAEIRIYTDNPEKFRERESAYYTEQSSIQDYNKFLWWVVPEHVSTSHMLVIQWDGWVINPGAWTQDFLKYDYIGALWPWHKNDRVGNGGFSLRSTELMQWLAKKHYEPGTHEDDTLCRVYRHRIISRTLEDIRKRPPFHWAPDSLAIRFSHEHPITSVHLSPSPFGFHDVRNWPGILSPEQLAIRLEICERNPYVSQKKEYLELRSFLAKEKLGFF